MPAPPQPKSSQATVPSHDPHQGCQPCLDFIRDFRAPMVSVDPKLNKNTNWSASQLFHAACETCNQRPDDSQSNEALCSFCRHLRLRHLSFCLSMVELPSNGRYALSEPKSEAQKNCPQCQIFGKVPLGNRAKPYGSKDTEHYSRVPKYHHLSRVYLSFTQWRGREVQWRLLRTGSDEDTRGHIVCYEPSLVQKHVRPDSISTLSPFANMARFNECIAQCIASHDQCKRNADSFQLPTNFRLIDVFNECLTTPSESIPEYVALSYVWGNIEESQTSKATMANFSLLSDKIDIQALPATICDALNVCRQLGERYLWVDRYCILQDDEEDKANQIQAMSTVYAAAKLVIVAASGSSMSDGLPGISRPRAPQVTREVSGMQINAQLPGLWDLVGETIWDSRGWTYQEAMLATRKLFFTDAQVYFECELRINHEEHLGYSSFDPSTHNKDRYTTSTTSLGYGPPLSDKFRESLRGYRGREPPWDCYVRHIPRFRQRTLRYHSDVVDAFTGILKALYPKDLFYFGAPHSEIDMCLLWTTKAPTRWKAREKNLMTMTNTIVDPTLPFPSWSWASSLEKIPHMQGDQDFRGSLCLWFKPVFDDAQRCELKPIMASSDSVQARDFVREDVPSRSDRGQSHLPIGLSIIHGLVAFHQDQEKQSWSELTFEQLQKVLKEKWPAYHDFWMDVYGQDRALSNAREDLSRDVSRTTLEDGMLITRTQVARLSIRKSTGPKYTVADSLVLANNQGRNIGVVVEESTCGQFGDSLSAGQSTFDCVALSLVKKMIFLGERVLRPLDMQTGPAREDPVEEFTFTDLQSIADETANTGAVPLEEKLEGSHSVEDVQAWLSGKPISAAAAVSSIKSKEQSNLLQPAPAVNVMVVRRENGRCFRLGLGQVFLKSWLELEAPFETVVLA